ncbi:MAG: flagellar hook-length control protein FliK [Burkholderiaceae bacterium]
MAVPSPSVLTAAPMAAHPETTMRGPTAAPVLTLETAPTAAQTPVHPSAAVLPPTDETFLPAHALVTSTPDTDTAASRSLQEFTAMMEAARATSGTALPPPASLVQPGVTALAPISLAPAGALAVQALASVPSTVPRIATPLSSPQWPAEFGRQVIHIAQNHSSLGQVAELRLDPPELGPLRITINMSDNVAHAMFSSPHAAVRQTVENALPQLQQMLEQAGISLGQANVNDQRQSEHAFQGNADQGQPQANGLGGANGSSAGTQEGGVHGNRPSNPNALVDTFA